MALKSPERLEIEFERKNARREREQERKHNRRNKHRELNISDELFRELLKNEGVSK